jgi:hypothetical protein
MRLSQSWSCSVLVTILGLTVTHAAPANTPESQRSFASAEDAVKAFVAALRDNQEADLRAILGPEADRVIGSGDRYADPELHQRFIALYDEKHVIDQKSPGRAELDVGTDDWPLPIPLIENNGRWTFDTQAGEQTIIDRPSAGTSCRRSVRCSPASMLSTIISIAPSRQREAGFTPRAWSARPAGTTAFTGR